MSRLSVSGLLEKVRVFREGTEERWGAAGSSKVTPAEVAAALASNGEGARVDYEVDAKGMYVVFGENGTYTLTKQEFGVLRRLTKVRLSKCPNGVEPKVESKVKNTPEEVAEILTKNGLGKGETQYYWEGAGQVEIFVGEESYVLDTADFAKLKDLVDLDWQKESKGALLGKLLRLIRENDEEGRFEKGATVRVKPTPEAQKKTYPAADWITKEMEVVLDEPCVAGGLDVVDVSGPGVPEDASVYAFNIVFP